jgi:hypothetical protein
MVNAILLLLLNRFSPLFLLVFSLSISSGQEFLQRHIKSYMKAMEDWEKDSLFLPRSSPLESWSWGCSHEETCNEALRLAKTLFYDPRPLLDDEDEAEDTTDTTVEVEGEEGVRNTTNNSQLSLNIHGYDETNVRKLLFEKGVVYELHDGSDNSDNNNNNGSHYWRVEATYLETTLAIAIKELKTVNGDINTSNEYALYLLLTAPSHTTVHIAECEVSKKYHGQPRRIVARQLITFHGIDGHKRVIATCLD